ncbi:hypothetical protein [Streptomyces mirabilis]
MKAVADDGYRGLANEFPGQVSAPPHKPKGLKRPEIERTASFPPTVNDEAPTWRVAEAFAAHFGDDAHTIDLQTASEDMSEIPKVFGAPFTYWGHRWQGDLAPSAIQRSVPHGSIQRQPNCETASSIGPQIVPTGRAAFRNPELPSQGSAPPERDEVCWPGAHGLIETQGNSRDVAQISRTTACQSRSTRPKAAIAAR